MSPVPLSLHSPADPGAGAGVGSRGGHSLQSDRACVEDAHNFSLLHLRPPPGTVSASVEPPTLPLQPPSVTLCLRRPGNPWGSSAVQRRDHSPLPNMHISPLPEECARGAAGSNIDPQPCPRTFGGPEGGGAGGLVARPVSRRGPWRRGVGGHPNIHTQKWSPWRADDFEHTHGAKIFCPSAQAPISQGPTRRSGRGSKLCFVFCTHF